MNADIQPIPRQFLPAQFEITDWTTLEPYFKNLTDRDINNLQQLQQWLKDLSELEAVVSEEMCWRQIKMTCDTENKELSESFNSFMMEIQPHWRSYTDILNRKLVDCPYTAELKDSAFSTYLRNIKKNISLFREENIPLLSDLGIEAQQFGVINGKMLVEIDGKEYTLQQAARFLEDPDRQLREKVYRKIWDRRMEDKDQLDQLFNSLLQKRNQVALNAGFANYRDYCFRELGRFDYNSEDCFQFHEAVKKYVLPIADDIYRKKKARLHLDDFRPWDVDAEPAGTRPLKPFSTGTDLLQKTILCLDRLDPFFADCLRKMEEWKRFDLESRKGKAPGGYNCPLPETGAPFIFMNAAGTLNDVVTLVHEGGHAVHSFLAHPLPLTGYKEYPTEFAEVASMSMELFSMNEWDVFFDNEEELKRARELQLERVITVLPWIATIDKFQHWIYENPAHTSAERTEQWNQILNEFTPSTLNTDGLESYRSHNWQRQLHLFEVPFYYIEYGIAQLGAIGMWQQFQKNKNQALSNYKQALSLGGTRPLPQLFEAAGLKFDFSPGYIKELMLFMNEELKKI